MSCSYFTSNIMNSNTVFCDSCYNEYGIFIYYHEWYLSTCIPFIYYLKIIKTYQSLLQDIKNHFILIVLPTSYFENPHVLRWIYCILKIFWTTNHTVCQKKLSVISIFILMIIGASESIPCLENSQDLTILTRKFSVHFKLGAQLQILNRVCQNKLMRQILIHLLQELFVIVFSHRTFKILPLISFRNSLRNTSTTNAVRYKWWRRG